MAQNKRKVTLRDIAEATGVTRMAVSLALRGKPGVSDETRKNVLEVAEKLGYEPDPEIAKLMSRIRTLHAPEVNACLGLLTSGATTDDWTKSITERKFIEGAHARAKEYGYHVDHFWIDDPKVTPARLSNILWNRGIEGVIVAPLQKRLADDEDRSIQLDFSLFSFVEISETVSWPDFDRAIHDQYTSMLKCLRELVDLNYQRIGLVIEHALDLRVNGKWTAAYLWYRHHNGARHVLPPLLLESMDQDRFDAWFERYKPDVIISVDRFALRHLEPYNLRYPQDLGYVTLDLDGVGPDFKHLTGIDQNSFAVGAASVDMLVTAIHRETRGIPTIPRRTEIEGVWVPGESTCRQPPPS